MDLRLAFRSPPFEGLASRVRVPVNKIRSVTEVTDR